MTAGPSRRAPSYPLSYRIAATCVVLGLALGAWQTRGTLLQLTWSDTMRLFVVASLVMVLMGYGHIVGSRTTVHEDAIENGWLWTERIAWSDVMQVQLLHWPALAWLVAPRLMVRARGRGRLRIPLAEPHSLLMVRQMVFGPSD
jgi:hypothetical protein